MRSFVQEIFVRLDLASLSVIVALGKLIEGILQSENDNIIVKSIWEWHEVGSFNPDC